MSIGRESRRSQHRLDAGGRHARAPRAPHVLLGEAAQGHPGRHHRSPARLPARPHLRRRCPARRTPTSCRAIPTRTGFWPDVGASNDVVYVPRDAGDITLADPAAVSRRSTGSSGTSPAFGTSGADLLERNSCRDPWVHETTARLSKRFRLGGPAHARGHRRSLQRAELPGQRLGPGPPDPRWTSGTPFPLLELVGYDTANARGVYEPVRGHRRQIDVDASRWRLQLGATLSF